MGHVLIAWFNYRGHGFRLRSHIWHFDINHIQIVAQLPLHFPMLSNPPFWPGAVQVYRPWAAGRLRVLVIIGVGEHDPDYDDWIEVNDAGEWIYYV